MRKVKLIGATSVLFALFASIILGSFIFIFFNLPSFFSSLVIDATTLLTTLLVIISSMAIATILIAEKVGGNKIQSKRALLIAGLILSGSIGYIAGFHTGYVDLWDKAAPVGTVWISRDIVQGHDAEGDFVAGSLAWTDAVVDNFIEYRSEKYGENWVACRWGLHHGVYCKLDYYVVVREG
ncbi:MAG: hypothetical protein DRP11_02700 [Candidatus Aenigmatarchaeota archaeon]|nr:MAG: hypothetical protein DRP11_02700 [Candidatus Aenigmarchaeota archaeon]